MTNPFRAWNSYSATMFNPERMRVVLGEVVRKLPELQEKYGFTHIAVTGKSGAALGFALSLLTGIGVLYVRKGESTHGDMVEGDGKACAKYAFFDDFVASGATLARVRRELNHRAVCTASSPPDCVVAICYDGHSSDWRTSMEHDFSPGEQDEQLLPVVRVSAPAYTAILEQQDRIVAHNMLRHRVIGEIADTKKWGDKLCSFLYS